MLYFAIFDKIATIRWKYLYFTILWQKSFILLSFSENCFTLQSLKNWRFIKKESANLQKSGIPEKLLNKVELYQLTFFKCSLLFKFRNLSLTISVAWTRNEPFISLIPLSKFIFLNLEKFQKIWRYMLFCYLHKFESMSLSFHWPSQWFVLLLIKSLCINFKQIGYTGFSAKHAKQFSWWNLLSIILLARKFKIWSTKYTYDLISPPPPGKEKSDFLIVLYDIKMLFLK